MALAFNAQVTCGSTKAEVLDNNRNWFDILDVSVVDGFNEFDTDRRLHDPAWTTGW